MRRGLFQSGGCPSRLYPWHDVTANLKGKESVIEGEGAS